MEQAFGYRGNLRFVEFSYSPRTHEFGYSDGGDHLPSDAQLWKNPPEFAPSGLAGFVGWLLVLGEELFERLSAA
jgi:hypothetical protein